MVDAQQKPPFYEQRWFKGTAAVIAVVAALTALIGIPNLWDVASKELAADELALVNTEIVLDASAAMAEPFGKGTKLDAAVRAIETYVAPLTNDGLALRRAGGSCSDAGDLLVNFSPGNAEEVSEESAELEPAGSSNVIAATRAAVSDFGHPRFRGEAATKRILIFMGGEDECAEDAVSEIRDDLHGTGIAAVFRLIPLKVSGQEMRGLREFKQSLEPYAEVEIRPADSEEQLEEVMEEEREDTLKAAAIAAEEGKELQQLTGPPSEEPEPGTSGEPGVEPEPAPEPEPEVEEPVEEEVESAGPSGLVPETETSEGPP